MSPIIRSLSRKHSVAFGIVLLLATARTVQAELSMQTRPPSETKETDRNEDGQIDTYWEQHVLSGEITIEIVERLEEPSRKLKARIIFVKYQGEMIWHDAYTPSLQERMTTVEKQCPFQIHAMSSTKSGEESVFLLDDKGGLVAALIGEVDGRLAPVTDEELERLRKTGQAVAEFAEGIMDEADKRIESERQANESK